MKNSLKKITALVLIFAFIASLPFEALAVEGNMGYEGGISIMVKTKKDEYQYSEMCFLTGKPILLTGTLTIKKTDKNGTVNATYTYRLENSDYNVILNRVVLYTTTKETKPNGQITEVTKLSRMPTEVYNINGVTYRLTEGDFSRSILTDPKPGINYHAGEFTEKKVYTVGTGANNSNRVTVELSGKLYAYDQNWSSTQTQKINVVVESESQINGTNVKWGGTAEVIVSSAARNQFMYSRNEPNLISFEGGYVKKSWDESVLNYVANFPEFDSQGRPTDVIKTYSDTHSLNTSVEYERLMVPDLKHIGGFWAEEPISILYALEVIPGNGANFKIGKYVTRAEFVAMLINALKDIPEDPNLKVSTIGVKKTNSKTPEVSPFNDVSVNHPYYEQIKKAYQKGITRGSGNGRFSPNALITKTEAVKMIISALGLENLAPYPYTSTPFTDNDQIPSYARNAAAVAANLGLIMPDELGRFNPNSNMTSEYTAKLLYDLISYMGDELIKDYRDRMIEF